MNDIRGLRRLTLCLFILLWTVPGEAQQARIGRILQVNVSGNTTADASVIKLSSGLREGEEFGYEDIQKAIRNLWAHGLFSDIRIIQDQRTPDGLILTIQVREHPRLEKVQIKGNKKIKTDEIEKQIGLFRYQVIGASQITRARHGILRLYAGKGYTLARVEADTLPSEHPNRVILSLDIEEGQKVQIQRIRFFGNTVFTDNKLRKQMKDTKENRWWRGADFDKDQYAQDKENVIDFYRNHGYRDAEIVRDSLYYDELLKNMFVDIWVNEGRCYYVGHISWEGHTLFTENQLSSLLAFDEGDPFSQEKYIKSIYENIHGAYYDQGYIRSQVNPIERLRGQDTLDVHFVIMEGEPVKIRKILITGNTRTKDRVIRREMRIRPGDVFSKELLIRSARDLMMLNYFANVVPDVLANTGDEELIDLTLDVEEKSTDTANLSGGWSEIDRLIGSVGLAMNNLFGNGQSLSLDWSFGRYYRSFNIGFSEPWFLNTPTLIGASIYDTRRNAYWVGYSQKSRGFSLRFGRRFRWPDNYFRGDWIYRLDQTELGDFSDYIIQYNPNNIVHEKWPLTSSGVTQIISRNSLDQPEFPTRGSQVSLTSEIAGGPLGGNVGYHKHIFSAEYFTPTLSQKLILLSRAQVGFMQTLTGDSRIPYLEYFFMGGSGLSRSTPLRGYDDPLAGGGVYEWGGRTMLKTTFELRFPLIPNPTMYGLLFAEAGNTWRTFRITDPFSLRRSVGIGVRLFMPMVGMIGFDYAYGFDHEDLAKQRVGMWKPHFVFGRSF
ncbi:MAG TPA: outer membrane protein assembly factor BamA [bacterium]|nr:outer membrane protein assembly factor BamA [bacterium]